jgi:hypothetical protein
MIRKTNRAIIQQTAKDILNKNLVTEKDKLFLTDPNMIKQAIHAYDTELIKEYSCPNCNLTIKCPKKWIILHHNHCKKVKDKQKMNEVIQTNFKPYGYF